MSHLTRKKEDQNTWNFLLSLLFASVFVVALSVIMKVRGGFPHSVPLFDFFIMAGAAFRITRLVVYDKITRFFREWFVVKATHVRPDGEWVELIAFEKGLRRTIHDLLGCPWCVGFWSALVVVFVYFIFDWGWLAILFLAVAGMGSVFQIVSNLIGWRAENFKLDAQARTHE